MRSAVLSALAGGTLFLATAFAPTLAQTRPQTSAGSGPATTADAAAGARAMLTRAVEAVQRDKQKALLAFTRGTNGFSEGELYVFCFGPDGKIDAHPNAALLGVDAEMLVDRTGKHFAAEMLRLAKPGTFAEVTYSWPKLLTNEPLPKTSYVTRVDDQVCGVGYYK